jgi:hypothetical protein
MEYNNYLLAALGILGILMHNLVKMNELNRKPDCNFNLRTYLRLEIFSVLLSVCVITVALIAKTEIKQLDQVGKWLGLSFVAIGYMSQSIVIAFMGKAQKFIDK